MTRPVLETFARDVKAACDRMPVAGRFGRKVWIHAAWAVGGFDLSLETFKGLLWEACNAGLLELARADLVEAFDPHNVRRSRTPVGTFEFHFIRA